MRMNLDHVASGHFVLAWAWERRSLRVLLLLFVIANFRILPVDSRAGGQGALCYTRAYIFRACATKINSAEGFALHCFHLYGNKFSP